MKVTTFFKMNQPRTRIFSHLLFWGFAISGVLMQLGLIDVPLSDFEWFLSYLLGLSAIGMLIPTIAFNFIQPLTHKANEHFLGFVESLAGLAMLASWIGGAGLYRVDIEYDTFVHFFATMLVTIIVVTILLEVDKNYKRNVILLALLAAAFALGGGLLNEIFEYSGDRVFGTMMFGDYGEPEKALDDTLMDFIANTFGVLVGGVIAWENRAKIHKYIRK